MFVTLRFIDRLKKHLALLKNLQSEPEGLPGAYGRNSGNHQNLWQALEVALTTLLPERRCLSSLETYINSRDVGEGC